MEVQSTVQPLRALFYSHDTVGLGHLRRTLLLANGLDQRLNGLDTLIVTGSAMAHGFRLQPNVDYVKLPSVQKVANENYASRTLSASFSEILRMRTELITATARTFRPDILFVDNVPLGMKGEVVATLKEVRATNPACRIMLNLRDVIDAPERIVPLWRKLGVFDALHDYYDGICVYGHSDVFDLAKEYEFPEEIRSKTRYCGYLPRPVDPADGPEVRRQLGLDGDETLVVATVGGGIDGTELVDAFLKALPMLGTRKVRGVVLLGPEMADAERDSLSEQAESSGISLMDFTPEPLPLFSAADAIVSMGGYNTVSEILALEKRAVVVPRVTPRVEQLLRCERLQNLNLLDMIHPAQLTPRRLASELEFVLSAPPPPRRSEISFGGLDELARIVRSSARPLDRVPVLAGGQV